MDNRGLKRVDREGFLQFMESNPQHLHSSDNTSNDPPTRDYFDENESNKEKGKGRDTLIARIVFARVGPNGEVDSEEKGTFWEYWIREARQDHAAT